jgi:hypothetical protein
MDTFTQPEREFTVIHNSLPIHCTEWKKLTEKILAIAEGVAWSTCSSTPSRPSLRRVTVSRTGESSDIFDADFTLALHADCLAFPQIWEGLWFVGN